MHFQHVCVMVYIVLDRYVFYFCFHSLLSLSLSLSVLLFSDFLEDSVNLESVINLVWIDIVLEVLLCGAESFCFDSWFNKESLFFYLFYLFVPLEKQCFLLIKWSAYLNSLICQHCPLCLMLVTASWKHLPLRETIFWCPKSFLKTFFRLTGIIIDCIYSIDNLIFIYNIVVVFFIFFASSTNK